MKLLHEQGYQDAGTLEKLLPKIRPRHSRLAKHTVIRLAASLKLLACRFWLTMRMV